MLTSKKSIYQFIVGIDEAGRGPLAGPVVVGGVKMYPGFSQVFFRGIRDSKKLSEKQREGWYKKIIERPDLAWAVSIITHKKIDTINIFQAAQLGAYKVFKKLAGGNFEQTRALLDGSLYLPCHISQETIIKGDEKIPLIAAASIIAKVTRDRIMRRLHKKFPHYAFDRHKGYGTLLHRKNIVKYGLSPVHRVSFCKKVFAKSFRNEIVL